MDVELVRFTTSDKGTFGVILLNGAPYCVTCERPWLDNKAKVSCIPEGVYEFRHRMSPKNGWVWEAVDVPGRSAIQIHSANIMTELLGCIAPGRCFGVKDGYPAVLMSRLAFDDLKRALPDTFTMRISNRYDIKRH